MIHGFTYTGSTKDSTTHANRYSMLTEMSNTSSIKAVNHVSWEISDLSMSQRQKKRR